MMRYGDIIRQGIGFGCGATTFTLLSDFCVSGVLCERVPRKRREVKNSQGAKD